jgi:hypothetical protein
MTPHQKVDPGEKTTSGNNTEKTTSGNNTSLDDLKI